MDTVPQRFVSRRPFREILESAEFALREKRGFSLIRLGDGEGPVLSWPACKNAEEQSNVFTTWLGHGAVSDDAMDYLSAGLRRAVQTADVIGLPTIFQFNKSIRYAMVFEGIEAFDLCSSQQLFADSGLHFYLQWSGALRYLLRGLPRVTIIGCRDIGEQVAEAFCIGAVTTYLVRGEAGAPGAVSKPHWREGFDEIWHRLDTVAAGDVFLVGAGVFGKLYCEKIKARGGVALDIGSIIDGWAGVLSRPSFHLSASAFTLAHHRTVGSEPDAMLAALRHYASTLHAHDETITL